MNDRTVRSPEELLDSIIITLPRRIILRLEAHSKKIGITPSAVVNGALVGYFNKNKEAQNDR